MKANFKNKTNMMFVFTILISVVLGCDAWVSLKGKISDENGNPVANAKITVEQVILIGKDQKVAVERSKDNGEFQIRGDLCTAPLCSGTIKLTVIKEGYQNYENSFSQKELERGEINIVLKKN